MQIVIVEALTIWLQK